MKINKKQSGFTLIEILVVIGIIAILAAVVIVALNPARQFAQARNTQRTSNANTILNAVWQRMVDSRGVWDTDCGLGAGNEVSLPDTLTGVGTDTGLINIAACIVPTYVSSMVLDPSTGTAEDTGYRIMEAADGGRITVDAPGAELEEAISVTR